jgi:UDP-3-O-[3-hydroxymyristoyl] glucosamine N-acyltransferase
VQLTVTELNDCSLILTAADIAARLGGELIGSGEHAIAGFAGLDTAASHELVFIASQRWAALWPDSGALVALVSRGVEVPGHDDAARTLILVDDAEVAMMMLLDSVASDLRPLPESGIHEHAFVDSTADIGADVHIGAGVVVQAGARIGDGAILHARCHVGLNAVVGESAVLHSGAVLGEHCELGARSILHQGSVVGSEGFGFRPDPESGLPRRVPHLGTVQIGAEVEIGACTCVDRGKFGPTVVGDGTKIDNLVQVAHNVQIGRGVIIAGQAGLAGSVVVGDGAILGAQVGVAEHVKIGPGARIAATSGVIRDVPEGKDYAGTPARPARQTLREVAALRRLPELVASMPRRESS